VRHGAGGQDALWRAAPNVLPMVPAAPDGPDPQPQQLDLVLALMQSSSRLTLEAAHLLAQSYAEAQAQADRHSRRSSMSPSRSLATSPTRRPTSRLAQRSPSQASASPIAHPLSRPHSAQYPRGDSRADAFHARLVASHGTLRVPNAAGEGMVEEGKELGEKAMCPSAASGGSPNRTLDGGRQQSMQAQDQMGCDGRHSGLHAAAESDTDGGGEGTLPGQQGRSSSSSSNSGGGVAADAAGLDFHHRQPSVPTITLARDIEDADPALVQMGSPSRRHTTTTHQHHSPQMAAQPPSRPQSASSTWTDRHHTWRNQPMAQVVATPPPLLSQRPLDPFTHSSTSLAHSRTPPPLRPHSASHTPHAEVQQPLLSARPASAAAPPTAHSRAQSPTRGAPGYPLPYLHARTPSPELPPRMAVLGSPAAQTAHPTLTSSPSQSSASLSVHGVEGPQQVHSRDVFMGGEGQEEGRKETDHLQDEKHQEQKQLESCQEGQQQEQQRALAGMAAATKDGASHLPVINLQALDPSLLLCRSFRLAPEEIEELGVGLLALVRHAGGFPHVTHNGALISASGTTVIAPPAGTGGMPDSSTQRDLLSQLYIHTAGIVAAQHRRAAALKAFESDLEMRLKGLQQAATRVLGLHKSSGRAEKRMQQQVQELAGCSDVAHAIQNEDVQQQQQQQQQQQRQARIQEQASAAAALPQPLQQHTAFLLHALESLAQDVGHARAIVDQARAGLQGLGVHPPPPPQNVQFPGAGGGDATHPGWTPQSAPQHTHPASARGEHATTPRAHTPPGAAPGFDQARLRSPFGGSGRMSSPSGDSQDALSGLASIQRLMQQLGGASEDLPHQTNISDASTALLLAELLDPVELFQRLHRSPSSRLSSPALSRPSSASPLPQRAHSPSPRPSSTSPVYHPSPSRHTARTASGTTLPPLPFPSSPRPSPSNHPTSASPLHARLLHSPTRPRSASRLNPLAGHAEMEGRQSPLPSSLQQQQQQQPQQHHSQAQQAIQAGLPSPSTHHHHHTHHTHNLPHKRPQLPPLQLSPLATPTAPYLPPSPLNPQQYQQQQLPSKQHLPNSRPSSAQTPTSPAAAIAQGQLLPLLQQGRPSSSTTHVSHLHPAHPSVSPLQPPIPHSPQLAPSPPRVLGPLCFTPPSSPRAAAGQLPPGQQPITLSPSLLKRSEISPRRGQLGSMGDKSSRRAGSAQPRWASPPNQKYARRPYTARAYVEYTLSRQGAKDDGV